MKNIKSLLTKKIIISVVTISSIVAMATCAIAKNKHKEESKITIFQDDFHKQFFGSDIFAEMEEMEKQMQKSFEEHRKLMAKMWKNAEKNHNANSSRSSLTLTQEDKFYVYELKFNSFKKDDISIGVNDGIMTISAHNEVEKKDKKEGESFMENNLFYSLSIPKDVAGQPEIARENEQITIKFARKKSDEKK